MSIFRLRGKRPGSVVHVPFETHWHTLQVIHADGRTELADFPDMGNHERLGSALFGDVPNPKHVLEWAQSMGYEVDDLSLELLVGRWEIQVLKRYP